jgi:hypothetical protein
MLYSLFAILNLSNHSEFCHLRRIGWNRRAFESTFMNPFALDLAWVSTSISKAILLRKLVAWSYVNMIIFETGIQSYRSSMPSMATDLKPRKVATERRCTKNGVGRLLHFEVRQCRLGGNLENQQSSSKLIWYSRDHLQRL